MGQALYRKYRSKSLDEIVGQEHIITALRNALEQGRLNHAYLFTGPRGVGKTSIARILAHDINKLPYTDENAHIDIIEIDAASNRGIDEIRDLREKVYIAPTTGKYKVYIIDEVHMLTPQAFNALLKTLEEPPAHVVFILATTEAHKLPATIISRTQRYTFRPADPKQLVAHLRSIANKEKLTISDEALELIAEHGEGSFRDSVGLLDQVAHGNDAVEASDIQTLLGVPSATAILELVQHLANHDIAGTVATLQTLYQQGYQAAAVAKQLATLLRRSLLDNQPLLDTDVLLGLLKNLIEVPVAHNANRFLELTLLERITPVTAAVRIARSEPETTKSDKPKPTTAPELTPKKIQLTAKSEQKTAAKAGAAKKTAEPEQTATSNKSAEGNGVVNEAIWPQILGALKSEYNTLYSIVRMAQPEFTNNKVSLTFAFSFHQKRLNETKNKTILNRVIAEVCGQEVEIECLFDKDAKPAPAITPVKARNQSVDNISNIFGGGELLES
jgi:DNA polymerase-3 subunit gamma/tau